ncbi:MAG: hypothetical protein V1815_00910 [Candidatus Woesearchaeota archaeon]
MKEKAKKTNKTIITIIILGVIVIFGMYLYYNIFNAKNNSLDKDNLAKCLTNNGAKMYGAFWCPHCQEQKDSFGESFKYINYVECTEDQVQCDNANIEGYPTWIINGQKYPGVQSLDQLKKLGGC